MASTKWVGACRRARPLYFSARRLDEDFCSCVERLSLGADAGIGVGSLLSEDFEGERQRVAGKDCRPFVISLVHGWLPPGARRRCPS
jgi:hypothetical protein